MQACVHGKTLPNLLHGSNQQPPDNEWELFGIELEVCKSKPRLSVLLGPVAGIIYQLDGEGVVQ